MKFIRYFLLCFLLGCNSTKDLSYDLILSNGTVIDIATGQLMQQDIFILNGRIQRIAVSSGALRTKATKIVDISGKYVLPGLWDNHVHFRGGDSLIAANKNFLNLFIANGITTVRDAGGDLTPAVQSWNKAILQGQLTGPNIFTSGPKIDGPNASWAGSIEVATIEDVSKALDSLQTIGVDYVKLYDSKISGELYLKTIREAEKRGVISSGHMPFTVTLDDTVMAGIDGIEHLYYIMKGCSSMEKEITKKIGNGEIGFWQAMPLLLQSYEEDRAQKTFQTLIKNKVFVVPTLHIGETLSYLDEVDHTKDLYLKLMSDGIIKTYQGRIDRALSASPENILQRKEIDKFFGTLAKSLNDAGVGLLAGSDSGAFNSYTYPGISLHKELEAMVANGISPLEALRTSAYNGSIFLNQQLDYGTIEVGKISDLVVLNGNPLENISNTQKLHLVLKGKNIYNAIALQNLLEDTSINKN